MVKFNVYLTASKLMAYVIMPLSFIDSIVLKDSSVFIAGLSATTVLLGVKTLSKAFGKNENIAE